MVDRRHNDGSFSQRKGEDEEGGQLLQLPQTPKLTWGRLCESRRGWPIPDSLPCAGYARVDRAVLRGPMFAPANLVGEREAESNVRSVVW